MKKIYLLLFCFLSSLHVWSQERTISGTVSNSTGSALPGVTIIVKGTQNGQMTDGEGKFSIGVSEGQNTLVVSFSSYETQEVDISGKNAITVTLQELSLDEVVVVGYGTQKKVNLTGAVEVISGEQVARQPVFQTSQALVGLSPGLTAIQSSGQPGNDNATLRVRGTGTIGGNAKNNPLILVDGVPDDLNGVDPNDIESISVLKDAAAAAIYGSRAANGVILITTKRAKAGEVKVSYTSYYGIQEVAQNLQFADAIEFMRLTNVAAPGSFEESFISEYENGRNTDPDRYPDTDWVGEVFNKNGFQQYQNVSIKGGTASARVAASLSYMDQDGNIDNYNFKRYNGRINSDFKVSEKFDFNLDINFRRSIQTAPSAGLGNITRQAYRIQPLFTAINTNGTWGPGWNGTNPVAHIYDGGLSTNKFNYFRGLLKANYRPVDGLTFSLMYAPQYNSNVSKSFTAVYEWEDLASSGINPPQNSLRQSNTEAFTNNLNAIVNYVKTFGDHNIGITGGFEIIKFETSNFSAFRDQFILQDFQELNQGSEANDANSGSATHNGLQSFFGRINYDFQGKYLLEANIRRDASSRFAPENRVSIFPSFSAGWRVSQEDFMQSVSWINDLKLRASWGELGNQQIGSDFPYQSLIGIGNANFLFGGNAAVGAAQTVLANRALQWETTQTTNVGLDAGFLDNRLTLSFDYYTRDTKDILVAATVPISSGLNPPVQNVGTVNNTGWDLALGWREQIGEFTYGIRVNASDVVNEVTDLGELDQLPPGNTIIRVGSPLNSIFGYHVTGFFQNQEEIDAAPAQFGALAPGDLRYANQLTVDVNDDGIPDEADEVINGDDRVVIGDAFPRKSYAVDLNAEYKGFDLSISLQGVADRDVVLQGDAGYAFFNAGKIQKWQTNYWRPDNPNADYPRLNIGSSHNNWRTNSFFLFDASYLRVRNVTLGYTLPDAILDKISIDHIRVYVAGQNVLTFDNMPEGIDPQVPNFSSGAFYPVTSTYILGLNVNF